MSQHFYVQARWDPEAEVWVSSSNVPGLTVEADTLAEFVDLAKALAPEMLFDNLGITASMPLEIRMGGVLGRM
jgi:hypothetical protein